MAIVLVRHGETAGNKTRVVQPADTPLNEAGLRQADRLAERVAQLSAVHIMTSDLPRALMTAEAIARRTGLSPELVPLLEERNFGDLRGTPYAELPDGNPFGPDVSPKNGETWAVFHARIARAWELVKERARTLDGNLVVVTHGLVVSYILGLVPAAEGQVVPAAFGNASISLLESSAPFTATLVNDVSFLGDERSHTSYGAA
jgi:broad specificity phosphatase PhoE